VQLSCLLIAYCAALELRLAVQNGTESREQTDSLLSDHLALLYHVRTLQQLLYVSSEAQLVTLCSLVMKLHKSLRTNSCMFVVMLQKRCYKHTYKHTYTVGHKTCNVSAKSNANIHL